MCYPSFRWPNIPWVHDERTCAQFPPDVCRRPSWFIYPTQHGPTITEALCASSDSGPQHPGPLFILCLCTVYNIPGWPAGMRHLVSGQLSPCSTTSNIIPQLFRTIRSQISVHKKAVSSATCGTDVTRSLTE